MMESQNKQKKPKIDKVMDILDKHYKNVKIWELKDVTNEQVARVIDTMKSSPSAGTDKISNRLMKTRTEVCFPPT